MSNNFDGGREVRRGRYEGIGNKGREVFTGKCDVRLSAAEDSALSRLAKKNGVSRSDVMRRALSDFLKFNSEE